MPRWYEYHQGPRVFEWLTSAIYKHSGIDLQAPCGTDITAPVEGTIVHSGPQPWGGQIDLATDKVPGYGPIIISYLHTSRQYVQANDKVIAGESLGASGQPPPGGRYGGGCHIHFEVTHGTDAPYDSGVYSPSQNPDAHHHPMDPQPLLQWLLDGHAPPDQSHGGENQAGDCGPKPNPNDYPGGTNNQDYQRAAIAYLECTIGTGGPSLSGVTNSLGTIAGFFGKLGEWVTNPIRIVKMAVGIMLVMVGLVIAFLPDLGAAAASAVGAPELAPAASAAGGGHPKRAAGSLIRAGGRGIGRQRAATKEEVIRQRSVARARTLEETRLQRTATTRRLRPAEQVQYAELRGQRGAEQERAARTAPLFMPRSPTALRTAPTTGPIAGPAMQAGRDSGQPPEPTLRARAGKVAEPLPPPGGPRGYGGWGFINPNKPSEEEFNKKYRKKVTEEEKKKSTPEDRQRESRQLKLDIGDLGIGGNPAAKDYEPPKLPSATLQRDSVRRIMRELGGRLRRKRT